ncbi:MAG: DNA damage-inducible protein D [Chloroflexota bacterium]|nr:DNA damage-inducible protein D [Chloroflexota bacterium]
MKSQSPDFESIKKVSPYEAEYWSARDLAPLLGYTNWQNFEVAIKRGKTACEQVGQVVADHFIGASKMVGVGSGAMRQVKDYSLSRFACYLIAQNGDPRKEEIAAAQAYFAVATRQNELQQLYDEQQKRLQLRERVSENNRKLAEAAQQAGVLSRSFGEFQNAGYRGLYGGLDVDGIKAQKGLGSSEEVLDRMGREELAANDFRITQTEGKLRNERIVGQSKAIQTHHEVGRKVREAIEEIGGTMPENLSPEPSIKPLIDGKRRLRRKLQAGSGHAGTNDPGAPDQDKLWD